MMPKSGHPRDRSATSAWGGHPRLKAYLQVDRSDEAKLDRTLCSEM